MNVLADTLALDGIRPSPCIPRPDQGRVPKHDGGPAPLTREAFNQRALLGMLIRIVLF